MKKTTQLEIVGMDCASCVIHIEKDLQKLEGVESAQVNFAMESGSVTYDEEKISLEEILKTIKKAGYTAKPAGESKDEGHKHHKMNHEEHGEDHSGHAQAEGEKHVKERLIKFIVALVLTLVVLVLSFVWDVPKEGEIMLITTLIILAYSGQEFFKKGVPTLLKGRPGMDSLVAMGVGTAFLYSSYLVLFTESHKEYFMDAAVISTFILLGRYLEARAKGKASEAIKKLLQLSAKTAHRVKEDGSIEDVPVEELQKGDKLRVKPGEKIPVDGKITDGEASINESMVTGESIPADKSSGDKVIGATINGNTTFTMEAEKVGKDTVLSQIIKMVQEAQSSKAPIQKLVDVVSGYFVWGVLAVALLTLLTWMFWVGVDPSRAVVITVSVLIIACPCALGLATPISIVVGSGKGAELGILMKNAEVLEKVHQVNAIAFDKTGTITKGEPEVQEYKNLEGDEKENLSLALSLEDQSEHPLAHSIVNYAKENDVDAKEVQNFEAVTGRGVKGGIDGKTFYLGSSTYLKELEKLSDALQKEVADWQEQGYTVLILASDEKPLGLFGVQDGVKDSSKKAIELLKKRNIRPVMLTGDNEKVAQHIADQVGIKEVHAQVSPEDKKSIIEDLQKKDLVVAMVGDGINDSPALAQANVGIAIGTGTDVAVEAGDLVLVKGDLMKAVEAIQLSEATLKNIKQNLFWAFIYNSVGIPIAAFGLLAPAFSGFAMAFSSVSVVLNALRLRRFKV